MIVKKKIALWNRLVACILFDSRSAVKLVTKIISAYQENVSPGCLVGMRAQPHSFLAPRAHNLQ